jgi:hypothetical protein
LEFFGQNNNTPTRIAKNITNVDYKQQLPLEGGCSGRGEDSFRID